MSPVRSRLATGIAVLGVALVLGSGGAAAQSQQGTTTAVTHGHPGASAPETNSPYPQLTIKATDYHFAAPAQVGAGLVSVTFENDGQEPHHAGFLRIPDSVSDADIQTALAAGPEASPPAWFAETVQVGGPGTLDPGRKETVTLDLAPGNYLVMCFIPAPDGKAHYMKGMLHLLKVAPNGASPAAPAPQADRAVKMTEFAFDLPAELPAGQQTWKVSNDGKMPHELTLIKLAPGKTMEDVGAFMQSQNPTGPMPFAVVGGVMSVDPGQAVWLRLDLEPGTYAALCALDEPESGKTHADLGMVSPFTVK